MKTTIFLPTKIKVGFNPRTDTYTGMLGYVIYHDGKVWRKENSWESWRYQYCDSAEFEIKKRKCFNDSVKNYKNSFESYEKYAVDTKNTQQNRDYYKNLIKEGLEAFLAKYSLTEETYKNYRPSLGRISSDPNVIPQEFENVPTEGFVLNKKAGGSRGHSWEQRATYCRVYDPRGFEFEISIPNLLYILENTSSFVGKGLEGKFMYGWDGKDLVLIPEGAPEFKQMVEHSELQKGKVSKKELVPGGVYKEASGREIIFLEQNFFYDWHGKESASKLLWFTDRKGTSTFTRTTATLKQNLNEVVSNYADLHAKLASNSNYEPAVKKEIVYTQYTTVAEVEKDVAKNKRAYSSASYGLSIFIKNKTKGYRQCYLHFKESDKEWNYDTQAYESKPEGWLISVDAYMYSRRASKHLTGVYPKLYDLLVENQIFNQTTIKKEENAEVN